MSQNEQNVIKSFDNLKELVPSAPTSERKFKTFGEIRAEQSEYFDILKKTELFNHKQLKKMAIWMFVAELMSTPFMEEMKEMAIPYVAFETNPLKMKFPFIFDGFSYTVGGIPLQDVIDTAVAEGKAPNLEGAKVVCSLINVGEMPPPIVIKHKQEKQSNGEKMPVANSGEHSADTVVNEPTVASGKSHENGGVLPNVPSKVKNKKKNSTNQQEPKPLVEITMVDDHHVTIKVTKGVMVTLVQ